MSESGDKTVSDRKRSSVGTKTLVRSLNDQQLDRMSAMRGDISDIRDGQAALETRMEKRIDDRFDQHDRLMAERQQRFDERDKAHDDQIGELRGENASLRTEVSTLKEKVGELDKKLAVALAKGLGAGSVGGGGLGALVAYLMTL